MFSFFNGVFEEQILNPFYIPEQVAQLVRALLRYTVATGSISGQGT